MTIETSQQQRCSLNPSPFRLSLLVVTLLSVRYYERILCWDRYEYHMSWMFSRHKCRLYVGLFSIHRRRCLVNSFDESITTKTAPFTSTTGFFKIFTNGILSCFLLKNYVGHILYKCLCSSSITADCTNTVRTNNPLSIVRRRGWLQ